MQTWVSISAEGLTSQAQGLLARLALSWHLGPWLSEYPVNSNLCPLCLACVNNMVYVEYQPSLQEPGTLVCAKQRVPT